MKPTSKLLAVFFLACTFVSCSGESFESDLLDGKSSTAKNSNWTDTAYDYSIAESATLQLVNDYRVSVGLSELQKANYISTVSQKHNAYMIIQQHISHDDFVSRSNDIIKKLGAIKVGENLAYNYKTPEAALKAWLNSPDHKINVEGDYTHFGISITVDSETGKTYYTNIFAKI